MVKIIRTALSTLAFLTALSFAVITLFLPFELNEAVAENRQRLDIFRAAAAYVDSHRKQHSHNPAGPIVRGWVISKGFDRDLVSNLGVDGAQPGGAGRVGCSLEEGFEPAAGDTFVLSVWNGDYFYCYAFPSGRTNLQTSTKMMLAGLWKVVVIVVLASVLFGLAGWRIWPRRMVS